MLKGHFQRINLIGSATYAPSVLASVEDGSEASGIMDTGAVVNLLSFSLAKPLLGLTPQDVLKGLKQPICGVGNATQYAYGFKVNLKLRATSASKSYLLLPDAWLYVFEKELPYDILIGQKSGFENRAFFHLNKGSSSYWSMKDL